MGKKVLSVRIDERIMERLANVMSKYDITQGVVVEIGLKYVLELSQKDFEREYLDHIKKA